MTHKKSVLSNLIITLVFGLLIFHTFTYFQNVYNFYTTLTVFFVVVVLSIYRFGGRVKLSGYVNMVFLYVMTVILIFVGVVIKQENLVYMVGVYLPYVIWPTLYFITEPLMSRNMKRKLLLIFVALIAVSVVATLSVLITDNNAARLLAGAASDATRAAYYSKGVGGYGFVYGCVFLIFGMVIWSSREERKAVKTLLWAMVALMLVMIIYSSYTIALMLSIIVLLLAVYCKSRRKDSTIIFALVVIGVVLLIVPILNLLHDLASSMGLEWITKRTSQLLNAEETGSFGELRRMQLYRISLDTFKSNFLLGGTRIGGHSMVLDHLGQYGIFGGVFCVSFFTWLIGFGKKSGKRIELIYWMFLALLCVNTADTMVMHPMVLYGLPLMLTYDGKKDSENQNSGSRIMRIK